MTAIELICIVCGEPFWSSGFDHICYRCACKQEGKSWSYEKEEEEELGG